MSLEIGRPLAASLLLGAALALGGLSVATSWADLTAAEEERDAKAGFVSRSLRAAQNAPGSPAGVPAKLFVEAESETLAAAEADARIRAIVADAGGTVLSSRAEIKPDETAIAGRIEVQAVVEAQNDAIQSILVRIENGAPLVLVDDLAIQPAEDAATGASGNQNPLLHAGLTLSAFWRSPPK